jgi:hypothetical protein
MDYSHANNLKIPKGGLKCHYILVLDGLDTNAYYMVMFVKLQEFCTYTLK